MKFEFVFFRIRRCGFYKQLERDAVFGDAASCFSDLGSWTKGKPLNETNTFDKGLDNDGYPVYCYDFQHHAATGDMFLTLWNEVHNHRGQVPTVDGSAKVGAAQASAVGIKAGSIPGYPSYFWIVPQANIYVAIIPDNSIGTGNGNFRKYLEMFLQTFSKHAVTSTDENGEVTVHGYSPEPSTVLKDVAPRLEVSYCQKPGDIEFLRKHFARIRKVIRTQTIDYRTRAKVSLVETLLRCIPGFEKATPTDANYRVKYEVSCQVSREDFDSIAESAMQMLITKGSGDIGFKLESDSHIYWLGKSIVKAEREWTPIDFQGTIVSPTALFAKISADRAALLSLVPPKVVKKVHPSAPRGKRTAKPLGAKAIS